MNLCTTWRKGIVGIQLFLTENPDDAASTPIALDPLGAMDEGTCETLNLAGTAGIKILKLGYDDKEIAIEATVGAEMEKKEYGDLDGNWSYVSIRDVKPIVGLYGKTDKKGQASLLGFLHLNTECQSKLGKEVEVEAVEEELTFEEKHKGFTISTPFILLIGVAVYFIVLVAAKRLEARTQTKYKAGIELAVVNKGIGWRRAQSNTSGIQIAPIAEEDETLDRLKSEKENSSFQDHTLRVPLPDRLDRTNTENQTQRIDSMKMVDALTDLNRDEK